MIRGDFLTKEQKEIKQKIMEGLMDSLFGNLELNIDKFNAQSMADIVSSCLIMFTREVMVRLIVGSGDLMNAEPMLIQFHTAVGKSIVKELREYVKNEGENH